MTDKLDAALRACAEALAPSPKEWRCFHCDEVFTDEAEAREHFGADMDRVPACRLSAEDVKQFRALEALNDKLRREIDLLDNDARLWHESEADRVRRIGNVQWWQELDSREGEKLVLLERIKRLEAEALAPRLQKVQETNDDQSRSEKHADSPPLQSSAPTDGVVTTPAPGHNEWRLDERGDLNNVVVDDVVTFRLERMADGHVWGRVYHRDGSQTDFNLHSDLPISLSYEHDGLPAPPRAEALAPQSQKAEETKTDTRGQTTGDAQSSRTASKHEVVSALLAEADQWIADSGHWTKSDPHRCASHLILDLVTAMRASITRTAVILQQHYPIELRCDHEAKTDECICSCGTYTAPKMPSIGEAIRTWAEHVAEALAPPEPGWQPIATAPKDHEGDNRRILSWSTSDGVRLTTRGFTAELRRAGWFDERGWLIHPTHWQPLPAPPRADALEAPRTDKPQKW